MCLTGAVEAGGISKGGLATAAEDIDGTMTDCGGGGAGAGWRMVETDGKGGAHVKNSKTMRLLLCVSNFVSVFTFLVRAGVITGTGYFAHQHSLRMP
jgi:hypothetical protein